MSLYVSDRNLLCVSLMVQKEEVTRLVYMFSRFRVSRCDGIAAMPYFQTA